MVGREHFAFPFDVNSDGMIATVEQESDDEIAGCYAVILSWPLGTRDLLPDFGVDEQAFQQGGADLEEIRTALQVNETRAIPSLTEDDEQLQDFIDTVRAGFARSEGLLPE